MSPEDNSVVDSVATDYDRTQRSSLHANRLAPAALFLSLSELGRVDSAQGQKGRIDSITCAAVRCRKRPRPVMRAHRTWCRERTVHRRQFQGDGAHSVGCGTITSIRFSEQNERRYKSGFESGAQFGSS